MKSSSGEHYLALDHVRALAVFLVFSFHFLHGWIGFPVPYSYAPAVFPLSLVNQGHTGVAMFMTLSGYLFAKLLDGKKVSYPAFFWNRILRLFPLLILVMIACGIQIYLTKGASEFAIYLIMLKKGFIRPTWPNGAWSIAIELHFYLLLPFILFLARKSSWTLPLVVLSAIVLRAVLHQQRGGEIHALSYLTIIGHIDQFILGIVAFNYRKLIANRHILFGLMAAALLLFFWWFDLGAGYQKNPSLFSPSAVWIYLPTLEGLVYGFSIAYYDNTFRPANTGLSKIVGYIGAYSYSIYLLHFFVVYQMQRFVHQQIMPLSNFYVVCVWSLLCFLPMLPIGYLSFRFIESPFLKFRRRYFVAAEMPPAPSAG